MIFKVNKIYNEEKKCYEADTSLIKTDLYEIVKTTYNGDGYDIEVNWIANFPKIITPAQGRAELLNLGLLTNVENLVNQQGGLVAIFWEYAVSWDYESQVLKEFSKEFNIDLPLFFSSANQINI
jgi:hypothetical protein